LPNAAPTPSVSDADFVVDASAVLALLLGERIDKVDRAVIARGYISTVNLAETLTKLVSIGNTVTGSDALEALDLRIVAYDEPQAERTAQLWPATRQAGLSLADRACLALGLSLRLPVVTADRAWARLKLGMDIRLIR
jgi:ribonuclease VapC